MVRERRSACPWGLLLPVALAVATATVWADFDRAMSAFKARKYHEAIAEFQVLVDQNPSYDYGHFMLGHCFLKMGRPADAERSFSKAIEIRKDQPAYLHGLAMALKAQRKYRQALEVLDAGAALAADPRSAFAFRSQRGHVLAILQRWNEAAAEFERALSIRRDKLVLDHLGRAYFALGRFDRAAGMFEQAVALEPGDPRAYPLLAESLLRQIRLMPDPEGKRELGRRALSAADRLHDLLPTDRTAIELVGRCALAAGEIDVAESALRTVVGLDPTSCSTRINLGQALVLREDWAEAERQLKDASRCAPRSGIVREALGYVYFKQGRLDDAAEAYRAANELQPSVTAAAGLKAVRARLDRRRTGPPSPRPSPPGTVPVSSH